MAPARILHPRIQHFDALENFRDYGDYALAAGRRLRPGRLFRSGHHGRLSDSDLARIGALDLGVVVDLRRPGERNRQPSRRPDGFAGQVIAGGVDDGAEAPHIAFLKSGDLTPESSRRFMTQTYQRMPFDPAHLDVFSRYFRALGETDGAVLIHCAAGKDRTGLLAALTHHLLGVDRDDIVADYLMTNEAVDLEGRAPEMAERLAEITGRRPSHQAVVAFLGVEPEFLEAAIAAISNQYGDLDGYLSRALGVDAAMRDRIIGNLSA